MAFDISSSSSWLEAIHQTLSRLEQRWTLPIPEATEFFAYDPLPVAEFISGVQTAAGVTDGRRFLDIGCGIGTKLALMHVLGWEVSGIERQAHYVEAAVELVPEATVTLTDLRDVTLFDADLIYMYRPGVTDETEAAVEAHVVAHLNPGAVLFLPCRDVDLDLTRLDRYVWQA